MENEELTYTLPARLWGALLAAIFIQVGRHAESNQRYFYREGKDNEYFVSATKRKYDQYLEIMKLMKMGEPYPMPNLRLDDQLEL